MIQQASTRYGAPAIVNTDQGSQFGLLAQRLVRKLCRECGAPVRGTGASSLAPVGCEHCGYTGYQGRAGVFELLITDDAIRAVPIKGGMSLMRDDGERLVQSGVTSREELVRVTRD